jgi:hypothetical protein
MRFPKKTEIWKKWERNFGERKEGDKSAIEVMGQREI